MLLDLTQYIGSQLFFFFNLGSLGLCRQISVLCWSDGNNQSGWKHWAFAQRAEEAQDPHFWVAHFLTAHLPGSGRQLRACCSTPCLLFHPLGCRVERQSGCPTLLMWAAFELETSSPYLQKAHSLSQWSCQCFQIVPHQQCGGQI